MSDRPVSVVALEALGILSALAALLWSAGDSPFGALAEFLIAVALTLWVTRGKSTVGRLFYTGLWVFAAIALTLAFRWNYVPATAQRFPVIVFTIQCVLVLGLLWWPTTTRWLEER